MFEFDEENQEFAGDDAEESVEEVLEEIEEEAEEQEASAASVSSKAKARIEEANLWNLLLSHSFFSPNSARPEIIASVNKKIISFATKELEILLGMRDRPQEAAKNVVSSPFAPEEVQVLKMLIGKVLKRDAPAPTPSVTTIESKPEMVQIQVSQPKVQQVSVPKAMQQKPAPKKQEAAPAPEAPTPKGKLRNKKDKGFARPNAKTAVKAMPSADQLIQQGTFTTPNIAVTGANAKDNSKGANLLGQVVKSLTSGGHAIAVDDSRPADSIDGGDVNGRF